MDAEAARRVIAGGDDAALQGAAAHGHGQVAQGGIVAHLDGGIETVAIAMDDLSKQSLQAQAPGDARNGRWHCDYIQHSTRRRTQLHPATLQFISIKKLLFLFEILLL
jgi:hypothetical protein